jgi:arsenite methyltransferase
MNIKEFIKRRYSAVAEQKQQSCCGGNSCCGSGNPATLAKAAGYQASELKVIPDDASLGLGCGSPIGAANIKEGETVLDLGSGAGMDVFLAASKVGSKGKVIGVDMTEAIVKRATGIAKKEGFRNVEFRLGEIESLPLEDNSVDAIVSNCVINLSTDKARVFREAFRVLRHGGRLVVSDIVTEGELPENIKNNPDLWAGCVAGAIDRKEYLGLMEAAGFKDLEVSTNSGYHIDDSEGEAASVRSVTVTAHK